MTKTHDPQNERYKRAYLIYMREAQQHGEQSLDAIAKALHRFESYTGFRDFRAFHVEQVIAFKKHLAAARSKRTGAPLSVATQYSTLAALKAFFRWLAGQPGCKRRLRYLDADYFGMSRGEARIAKTKGEPRVPSLEQALRALEGMPATTDLERRDRAVFAFILLTGARDGAVPTLKRKHLDLPNSRVVFDAKEVRTKFSKSFPTWFFPVGDHVEQIIHEWAAYLDTVALFGPDDPLFPATLVEPGPDNRFRPVGLAREHWRSADPIRVIFRKAFVSAGLPYYAPHSLRKTLTQLGERVCAGSIESFKCWSQNLGHEGMLTTLTSYGDIPVARQGEIIRALGRTPEIKTDALSELLRAAERVSSLARTG